MKVLAELRAVLIKAETSVEPGLTKLNDGQEVDTGVWVERFEPDFPPASPFAGIGLAASQSAIWDGP